MALGCHVLSVILIALIGGGKAQDGESKIIRVVAEGVGGGAKGGGGGEQFTCTYPLKVQARPPRDRRPALRGRRLEDVWHPTFLKLTLLYKMNF